MRGVGGRAASRGATGAAVVAIAALALVLAAPAVAAGPYPGIPDVRSAKASKLSPRLLALSRSPLSGATANVQADGVDLPRAGAGSLLRKGRAFLVYVHVGSTADATLANLRAAGLEPTHVSARYGVVTGLAEPAALARLAAVGAVRSVQEALRPQLAGASGATAARAAKAALAGSSVSCGSTISEGVRQLSADSARGAYDVDGSGVKVGVLSDSYDVNTTDATSAAQDVASGDLPGVGNPCGRTTPVTVLDEIDDPTNAIDEGRAMAQIVHDVAPGSPLAFATAFDGLYAFADNIRALRTAGAKVIVDDVSYYGEPMFQEGPVDMAVSDVVADGALYFSSAANSNYIVGGNDVSSYEAPVYRPTTCPAAVTSFDPDYLDCHDFNPGAGTDSGDDITVGPSGGFYLDLQWAQSWNDVDTDIDVFLVNAADGTILAQSIGNQTTLPETRTPFEFFSWTNPSAFSSMTVRIVIARYSEQAGAAEPRVKFVLLNGYNISSVQYNVSNGGDVVGPTIFGHNGSPDAFSVAAVPYNNRNTTENYSSRGPRTLYFGPADGTNPASPLGTPEVVPAPDIAATDGGVTTFFYGTNSPYRFYGTSAAAPHAAAVAALMAERDGSLTRSDVLSAFAATAHPIATNGAATDAGAGLIDALGAVQQAVPFGFVRSFTSPAGAVPGTVLFGSSWVNQWATDWVKVPVGSYDVSGSAVEGFSPPGSPVVANVTENATSIVSIDYETLGNLRVVLSPAVASTISIDGVRVNDWNFYAPFPAGEHEVCFGPVAGYDPPPCQTVEVAADRSQLTTVNATFTPNAAAVGESGVGYLRVAPLPAGQVPTTIFVDGEQRNQWALDWMKLPPGEYTVSFSDVEGFRAPDPVQVEVVANQVTTITPSFAVLGNLRVTTSPALPATIIIDGAPINDWIVWSPFAAGEHEVCFGYVPGYLAPACQTVTVPASRAGLLDIQGTYTTD